LYKHFRNIINNDYSGIYSISEVYICRGGRDVLARLSILGLTSVRGVAL